MTLLRMLIRRPLRQFLLDFVAKQMSIRLGLLFPLPSVVLRTCLLHYLNSIAGMSLIAIERICFWL
ncbi:hypothetical protein DW117_06035 [Collinsella sp. AM10-11]|nr:hypothetical protein DW129_03535 [Collinsella sp. AM10-48]RHJ39601.1 hypothetical protein DW126_04735 [Collinsella sp. AM10-32]RHJ44290.1 hypothetical protein DW124_05445 [Collinsella sp. AM10-27]RHJ44977.1 hypothetical protein DW123_04750 [Collinsella sp. AM10-26]RHJ53629.1 hypothetical protein DW117_06035 [Collinsella sp. AM10-11]